MTNTTWTADNTSFDELYVAPSHTYEFAPCAYAWDDESETTGPNGPVGNDWVTFKKGYAKGKAIQNGLTIGDENDCYEAPKGSYLGADAYASMKGTMASNVSVKAKAATFASQDYDYEVNDSTDTTGLKAMTGVEVVAFAPVDTTITTEWDAEAVAEAVETQVATFGKVSYGVKGTTSSKKAAYKEAALDKSLNAAFKTKVHNDDALSLDTTVDSDWTPVTGDPMDALIEEENETEAMIEKARAALSVDQWAMVLAKASGKSQREIAADLGLTPAAVCLRWKTIVKKATKATEVSFVA